MIRRLFKGLFGKEVWKVGKHRVEAYEVKIPGTAVHGDTTGVTARRKTKYRCIDCERTAGSREELRETDCYDTEVVV